MASNTLDQYRKWLDKEPKLDDQYVIIDVKWFRNWKRYIGLVKTDEESVADPGPLDFTKLTDPSTPEDSKDIQLRSDAVERNDFTFIPKELYDELAKEYEILGQPIVRRVIPRGSYDTTIETFLLPLRLRESKKANAKEKQIFISRHSKVKDLISLICDEYNIEKNKSKSLYASRDVNGTYWEEIDNQQSYIDDLFLIRNAYIIYDTKPTSTRNDSTSYTEGLCGLSNLGNTCFMNSALQCISNVPPLTKYFFDEVYEADINSTNPLGMKGEIARAYAELIQNMWSGRNSFCAPKSLKYSVARYAPQFSGYAQQDSQELMSFLLDGLHEDLNRVRQKPYAEKKDDDGTLSDSKLAKEQWDYYLKRNQSKIQELFHGQIKSVVQCLTCKTKARTFDPICFLSLPLPGSSKIRTFKIDYIRTNGSIKTYCIKLNEYNKMSNLVQAFCQRFQPKPKRQADTPMDVDRSSGATNDDEHDRDDEEEKHQEEDEEEEDFTKAPDYDGHQPKPDYILPAEIFNNKIHTQFRDDHLLTSILERDQIAFYESPHSLKDSNKDNILMPCTFRDADYRQHFGYPMYLSVPRYNCQGKHIEDVLEKLIGLFLPLESSNSSSEPLYTPYCSYTEYYHQKTVLLKSLRDNNIEFGSGRNVSIYVDVASSIVEKYKKQNEKVGSLGRSSLSYSAYDRRDDEKRSTTLYNCFKLFTKKEVLSDDDLWKCPKCNKLQKATKKMDIWLLPEFLIVHLKRFSYTRYYRDKIDMLVECPTRNLDLSQYVLNPKEKEKARYDLIAVSNHMGGLGGGHYTAYAKNSVDGQWHTYDDSYVSTICEEQVISRSAYVLIYQQKKID